MWEKIKNKYVIIIAAILLIGMFFIGGCANNQDNKKAPVIGVAASLQEPMRVIAKQYTLDTNNKVSLSFGGSKNLRRQIEAGAPMDGFFSASDVEVEGLIKENLVIDKKPLLNNEIAVAINNNKKMNLVGMKATGAKIAMGNPKSAPVGVYSEESLKSLGIYEAVKGNLVLSKDNSQSVIWLKENVVDYALLYTSDITAQKSLSSIYEFKPSDHSEILYSFAVVKKSKLASETKDFLNYLQSDYAKSVFVKYGFKIAK